MITHNREFSGALCPETWTVADGTLTSVGAPAARGRTIAVIGSGLLAIYPPENQPLAEKIATSGAVITEFSMHEVTIEIDEFGNIEHREIRVEGRTEYRNDEEQ